MKVPFINLADPYEELKAELDDAYLRFMRSSRYVLDREVEAFEEEFANYCEVRHCIESGTVSKPCI